jgi:hypothetical protein
MNRILTDIEILYDKVKGDSDDFIDEIAFENIINELVEIGFIEKSINEDNILYSARNGLKWCDFVHFDDPIKKSILLLLVENPMTFFVLLNTQKGKMRINSLEIKKWSLDSTKRVVGFVVVDNDTTLADQSGDGIIKTIGHLNIDLIMLSSTSKHTFDDIKKTIDAYEFNPDEYKMPVIVLLANNKQLEKMIALINHIHNKIINRQSILRYGIIWDEADKIYPQLRDKTFNISGKQMSIKNFIVNDNIGLYRVGFTTASDGQLLEEDYPECSNAYLYPVVISPEDEENYRALHHPEAIIHRVPRSSKSTNNLYAMNIINNNLEYFNTPIILPSGEIYYRKIIVNSNSMTKDMNEFAKKCNEINMNALVFNGYNGSSIKVYRQGKPVKSYKAKGKKFNEVLFYIYKKLHLNDKPLLIIGRRKVDRGLGFHYSPKTNGEIIIDYGFEEGKLITSNREGLIWTDMILGKIDDKDVAVQKSGRLAGIIGDSPQYSGSIHFWTDENTEQLIRRHNNIVDLANTYKGCSVLQAVSHAKDNVPIVKNTNDDDKATEHRVYDNETKIKEACKILSYKYISVENNSEGFKETSLNRAKEVVSLKDAISKVKSGYGKNHGKKTNRTYYPCYVDITNNETLRFVLIIRPGTDENKVKEIDEKYPQI